MDAGNTCHSTGVKDDDFLFTNPHNCYETYINNLLQGKISGKNPDNFHVTISSIKNEYGWFRNNLGSGINYLAIESAFGPGNGSNAYYNAVKTERKTDSAQTTYYDPVITYTLPLTEQFIAALLEQFTLDTKAISGIGNTSPTHRSIAVIKDGTAYYLRNARTNKYFNVKNSGTAHKTPVVQWSFTGNPNQIIVARYNYDDSSFGFSPWHALNLRLSFDSSSMNATVNNPSSTSFWQKFKPVYLEPAIGYRIMTGIINNSPSRTEYAYILRSSWSSPTSDGYANGQYLHNFKYNPDSRNHYWYFE